MADYHTDTPQYTAFTFKFSDDLLDYVGGNTF